MSFVTGALGFAWRFTHTCKTNYAATDLSQEIKCNLVILYNLPASG